MKAPMGHLRVGCDVVEIQRLATALKRGGPGFAATLFSAAELAAAANNPERLSHLFAVKEAALKSLGVGLAAGASLLDIEVAGPARDPSPATRPALLRHAVAWRHPGPTASAVAVTAYSWRRDDHVYARAYLDTGTLPS